MQPRKFVAGAWRRGGMLHDHHPAHARGNAGVNADPEHPSEIVEFTRFGQFVREYNVDAGQGGAFGLDTVSDSDGGFNCAAIDDVTNSLSVYRLSSR